MCNHTVVYKHTHNSSAHTSLSTYVDAKSLLVVYFLAYLITCNRIILSYYEVNHYYSTLVCFTVSLNCTHCRHCTLNLNKHTITVFNCGLPPIRRRKVLRCHRLSDTCAFNLRCLGHVTVPFSQQSVVRGSLNELHSIDAKPTFQQSELISQLRNLALLRGGHSYPCRHCAKFLFKTHCQSQVSPATLSEVARYMTRIH